MTDSLRAVACIRFVRPWFVCSCGRFAVGWLMPLFPLAFYLSVSQVLVGFLLFHSVNLRPKNPGITVAFHQGMVLSITLAIVAAGH